MHKKTVLWSIVIVIVVVAAAVFYQVFSLTQKKDAKAVVNGTEFSVEIADTMAKRIRGLGGYEPLQENEGMIFLFPVARSQTFWMKGVSFPIDIIWIAGNDVIGVESNVQPEPGVPDTRLKTYKSPGPADKVLEIKAGISEEKDIKAGDSVELVL